MSKPPFLKPFISYFGSKWRAAPKYPAPRYQTLVEPFAGGAGYACRHYQNDVILFDKYYDLVRMWNWLIEADYDDVIRLPVIGEFKHIDELDVPAGAKTLIGFGLNKSCSSECNVPSKWARSVVDSGFWIKEKRERVARQVEHIKHWKCYHIDNLLKVPNYEATWFIDPPYQEAGKCYKHGSDDLDFQGLATWCLTRNGQAIVCENHGADWFRFDYGFANQSTTNAATKDTKGVYRTEVWSHLQDGQFI